MLRDRTSPAKYLEMAAEDREGLRATNGNGIP